MFSFVNAEKIKCLMKMMSRNEFSLKSVKLNQWAPNCGAIKKKGHNH